MLRPSISPDLQPVMRELAKLLVQALREELAADVGKSDTMLPADVAKELKVSPRKVYKWIETGVLPAIDLNPAGSKRPRYSIERSDFEALRKRLKPAPVVRGKRKQSKPRLSVQRY